MSVVIFPGRHPGARQAAAFVLRVPQIDVKVEPAIYTGVDAMTQAAVLSEMERLHAALDTALECSGRLTALLRPYIAEVVN